ncbi:hypothetical protein RHMOL_Rhmol04G0292800 [Rhododendron molle]|uniref:Uncharacterized protein n=1 Tax=Rhododendron molle TaxID=49168 RepID=A0ACC0P5H2_RHOML|nr:hypothetical protein RHMOL_Rhmol04G0292800 [Rhododendron molle]
MAKLKDAGTIITNQTKRDIGDQWKSLSNEERQKYKDVAEVAKAKLAKQQDLFPAEPKEVKRKLQNRISLKSIVGIVNKLSADQRSAVEAIGLGGILQLRCTFLNHALCKWLVGKFDPVCRSLTVHGRSYVVTESHVEECLGINGQGNVIDLESHTKIDSCLQVLKNVGFTKGVVQLKDLRQYLEKTSEADDVFKTIFALYILGCFLCPNTKAGVTRSFTKAVSDVREMGKQNWAKLTLQFLCKGIQYQRDNHHVQPSGCLFLLVVFYLERVSPSVKPSIRKLPSLVVWGDDEIRSVLHQFDKIGGYDREGVVVHVTEVGEASGKEALLKGLQSCQSSPPTAFETHDLAIKESKGLSTNPSLGTHIGFEIPSRGHLEVEMGEEIDLHPLDPSARSSPQVTAPNKSETPTPTKFKTPDPVVHKSKGGDTRTDGKRRIPKNMDEDVSSPSPVKGFRSLAGLSRGRKRKLSIGNAIPYVGGYDNVKVQYEAPRLRQHDQLKKSHFQCSPYTKDGVKKRNPPKKQQAYVEDMAADERKRTYEPLTDHEKLFTEFIFDIRDPSNGYTYQQMIVGAIGFALKWTLLEGLHRALVCQYGDLYQVDVTKFNIATVERQPLQDDTDGYDYGLFVIKFMQGFNYPSGVHRMDDTERPRLLMELCADENNRDALEVMRKFDAWKAGRGEGRVTVKTKGVVKAQVREEDDVAVEQYVVQEEDVQGEILLQEELQLERANKEDFAFTKVKVRHTIDSPTDCPVDSIVTVSFDLVIVGM